MQSQQVEKVILPDVLASLVPMEPLDIWSQSTCGQLPSVAQLVCLALSICSAPRHEVSNHWC
jgi:hypothetical protein